MSNLKLGVEVVSAHNLMPKDGQDSSNHFVELHFDGQRLRSTSKANDLNPVWNENFYFNISDPSSLFDLHLDAYVYSAVKVKGTRSRSIIGKVRLTERSFVVPHADAVVVPYALQKHGMFSRVKGKLALSVYLTDEPTLKSFSNLTPAIGPSARWDLLASQTTRPQLHVSNPTPTTDPVSNERAKSSCTNQNQQHSSMTRAQELMRYLGHGIKSVPPKTIQMYPASSQDPVDYTVKEISPYLGRGQVVRGGFMRLADEPASTFDLVEQMQYLFVRVVRARLIPGMKEIPWRLDPFVEVRVGNYRRTTKHFEKQQQDPVWNEVFAFPRDQMHSSVLEVVVKDKVHIKDDEPVGIVRFELNRIPTLAPVESPLAPEWHRLEGKKVGGKIQGELMLAVWMGVPTDEALPDAWNSDATAALVDASTASYIRSMVYFSPLLWYMRVEIIEAEHLVVAEKSRIPEVYVKAQMGRQLLRTKAVHAPTFNPLWNEDLLLVVAEPFEDHLILSVEDREGPHREELIGRVVIPLSSIEKRADDRMIKTQWCQLEKPVAAVDADQLKEDKLPGRLHVRLCLEGGYHVIDEQTSYSSDLRPSAKELCKPPIGVLELGIQSANGLPPMKTRDGRGTADPFCVARYGHKWVRTRTVVNTHSPKFNEQHTWEVYDSGTVITVGVFDNCQISSNTTSNKKDMRIGKVRIRLSTLEPGRLYAHSYPLLALHPSGLKKMGELHLEIKFSCTSLVNMMCTYSRTLLPKMHYIRPLTVTQIDTLRYEAVNIVAARLSRAEPPLRKEVIEYMSEVDWPPWWSVRKSRANFSRLVAMLSGLIAVDKWFGDVCTWKNPAKTMVIHVLFIMLVYFHQFILPMLLLFMFLMGIRNCRYRPCYPPHIDTEISWAETVHPDELDEEFDTFPTSRSSAIVRMRYDRLRSVAGRMQTVMGDVATYGERVLSLLSWRDPVATAIFLIFCFVSALVLFVTPYEVIIVVVGFYKMRHPWFRHRLPSVPVSFYRRLPTKIDNML